MESILPRKKTEKPETKKESKGLIEELMEEDEDEIDDFIEDEDEIDDFIEEEEDVVEELEDICVDGNDIYNIIEKNTVESGYVALNREQKLNE